MKHKKLHNVLGVSKSSLYYKRKKPVEDWQVKQKIENVLHDFPSYGHKRIAPALHLNKKRIRRVMKLYGIKPYRRRRKPWKRAKTKANQIFPCRGKARLGKMVTKNRSMTSLKLIWEIQTDLMIWENWYMRYITRSMFTIPPEFIPR